MPNTPALESRFQALIDEHKKILYKVCNSYCKNASDREDLAQEIVVALWRSFASFDDRARFSTWMYRVSLNVAISFYRCENVRARHVFPDDSRLLTVLDETANTSPEVQAIYLFIEDLELLNKALVLLYLDGYTYAEIADVLGITASNVATKLSRLKQNMRREFEKS